MLNIALDTLANRFVQNLWNGSFSASGSYKTVTSKIPLYLHLRYGSAREVRRRPYATEKRPYAIRG